MIGNQNIPLVRQIGENNCLPASAESIDRSFGGSLDQQTIRNKLYLGSNPETDPMGDVSFWKSGGSSLSDSHSGISGHSVDGMPNYGVLSIAYGTVQVPVSLNNIAIEYLLQPEVCVNAASAFHDLVGANNAIELFTRKSSESNFTEDKPRVNGAIELPMVVVGPEFKAEGGVVKIATKDITSEVCEK